METTHLYPHDPEVPIEAFPPYSAFEACPKCGSHQIEIRNFATKAGCAIGALAGIGITIASSARGARVGASIGLIGGTVGSALGGIAGAVLDALANAAAGCATGITVGKIIDNTLLLNNKCHHCGHTFNAH